MGYPIYCHSLILLNRNPTPLSYHWDLGFINRTFAQSSMVNLSCLRTIQSLWVDVWLVHESLLCNRKYYTVMENICFLLLLRWLISTYLSSGKSSHKFLKVFGRHISFDRSSSAAGGIYNGRESYGWLHFRLHGLLTAWTTHCIHMFKKKKKES